MITLYELCSESSLTKSERLLVAINMCRSVAELHTIGLIHGDLSSENVMVDSNTLEVKLIDFDLSHRIG